MNKKTARRQRDLKSKLLAAVAMLLVSSMMMVTSTYAWFTLSTAPEVTGITTAVGANGNLEMALLPYYALDNTSATGLNRSSMLAYCLPLQAQKRIPTFFSSSITSKYSGLIS